ncbi:retinol dehydrogenase 7 [Atheta coriaria]|uniref:retinol dehydrogenase 7 n=1 Tax=Dalotia coriaria TaxID=877792 RepID=UPI0031F37B9C
MGISISKVALTAFELANEFYIALGSGFWGIAVLINHGLQNQRYGGTFCLSTITAVCLIYLMNSETIMEASKRKIIVISGCDSGLGFSMALHLCDRGFMVLAGCLDMKSDGAKKLRSAGVRSFDLNVTSVESVSNAVKYVSKVIEENSGNELWAVINNAGVMVFAEFEWQTDKLMSDQITVNLMGNMRMTKGFAPMLRQYRARLINVSSHCALESLPGLSVYGASKAAIKGLTDSLRVELGKYGVTVISFIPGSFPTQSNILARQMDYVYEMRSAFTKEQEEFYGDYFQRYNAYLGSIANPNPARKLNYPDLYLQLEHALLAKRPKYRYKVEPLRYCIYHALFRYSPLCLRDYFVEMFVRMPRYDPPNQESILTLNTVMSMRSNYDQSTVSDGWTDSQYSKYRREDDTFRFDLKESQELLDDAAAVGKRLTSVDLRQAPHHRETSVSSSQAYL